MKRALVPAGVILGALPLALLLVASAFAQNGYETFAIVQPEAEQTVHDNGGNVVVNVALEPGLARGHEVVLLLDGETISQWPAVSFGLTGLERGTHTLQALITDSNGDVVAASEPVTFNMWQASLFMPARRTLRQKNPTNPANQPIKPIQPSQPFRPGPDSQVSQTSPARKK